MEINKIIGRKTNLFKPEVDRLIVNIKNLVKGSRFLVIGGAGTIGQAVVQEIFKHEPEILHIVDISENNLVELVRDIRSSFGYNTTKLDVFALDAGSLEFERYLVDQPHFDYVMNLSALKHVRSEKDPYTLLRMIEVNIMNAVKLQRYCEQVKAKKYFCVSTDKAANPVNLMGASKRMMEIFLTENFRSVPVSMARFANVAFSNGSLLDGFRFRISKKQPISAPYDIRRYFITDQEAGQLCLMSCLFGKHNQIFFPNHTSELNLQSFSDIAKAFLNQLGKTAIEFDSEAEARLAIRNLDLSKEWPCYFFSSDTTGEKAFEEFYTVSEVLDFYSFLNIGIVTQSKKLSSDVCNTFAIEYQKLISEPNINKSKFVKLFELCLPEFEHDEKNKNLNERM